MTEETFRGWRHEPLAGLDLETDSVDVEDARIITAAVGLATPGASWIGWEIMLQPDRDIPDEASAVHGISTERARAEGTPRRAALQQVAGHIRDVLDQGAALCGMNIRFDLTILDRELRREQLRPLDLDGAMVIDPMVIDKHKDPYRKGSRKLVDLCAHYGVRLSAEDAHGASADALAATRLAWILSTELPDGLGHRDRAVRGGMVVQADWYRRQRESFAAWRRKQGRPIPDEPTDWPLVPFTEQEVLA